MEGETLIKHVMEIIYATRTLFVVDFPSPDRINSEFDTGTTVEFRLCGRREYEHEWISPMVYVTLWIMWRGQHWAVIEEVIMSHPHPHLDNVPHDVVYNAMPLCIIHRSFPSIKLTTRNFSFTGKKLCVNKISM